jgi:hypothetical protein
LTTPIVIEKDIIRITVGISEKQFVNMNQHFVFSHVVFHNDNNNNNNNNNNKIIIIIIIIIIKTIIIIHVQISPEASLEISHSEVDRARTSAAGAHDAINLKALTRAIEAMIILGADNMKYVLVRPDIHKN